MAKWADYLISSVRYDADHTHIEKVKTHEDLGEEVGKFYEEDRKTVVENLHKDKTYCTIKKGNEGWKKGALVGIIKVKNIEYIRTDKNETEADNLGELPEF